MSDVEIWADLVGQWYDNELKPAVTEANAAASAEAPAIRDIKANTYVFLTDESDGNRAVIKVVSDSKQPDVLQITGRRRGQIGRPRGSRNGVRTQNVPYANGIDLANVTNGAIRNTPTGPQQVRTGRAVPMPTQGWWLRVVDRVADVVFGR